MAKPLTPPQMRMPTPGSLRGFEVEAAVAALFADAAGGLGLRRRSTNEVREQVGEDGEQAVRNPTDAEQLGALLLTAKRAGDGAEGSGGEDPGEAGGGGAGPQRGREAGAHVLVGESEASDLGARGRRQAGQSLGREGQGFATRSPSAARRTGLAPHGARPARRRGVGPASRGKTASLDGDLLAQLLPPSSSTP